MMKLSRRNSLIVTIPLVAVVAAWVFLVFLPIQKAIARLQDEAKQMQQYCDRSSSLLPVLKRTGRELAGTRGGIIAHWKDTVPTRRDLPALLGKITALARSTGLRTTRFDPEPIIAHERIARVPLSMEVTGPFPRLFTFLGKLEKMPQTIWIEHLGIEKSKKDRENISCQIRLAIFMDNPEDSDQRKLVDNR